MGFESNEKEPEATRKEITSRGLECDVPFRGGSITVVARDAEGTFIVTAGTLMGGLPRADKLPPPTLRAIRKALTELEESALQ